MTSELIGGTFGTASSNLSPSYIVATKFTATVTGTITEMRCNCATAGHIQLAVYSDNSNYPGSLLASATSTAVTNGTNTITFPNLVVIAGTAYWLAANTDTNHLLADATAGSLLYSALTYGTAFPSTFPGGASSLNSNVDLQGWGVTPAGLQGTAAPTVKSGLTAPTVKSGLTSPA